MIKIIRGLLKKSIFIIITFTAISFIFSIATTVYESVIKSTSENNEFLTGETINCNVDLIDSLNHKDFLEFKKLNENILMYKDVSREIYKGVYFNGNKSPKFLF